MLCVPHSQSKEWFQNHSVSPSILVRLSLMKSTTSHVGHLERPNHMPSACWSYLLSILEPEKEKRKEKHWWWCLCNSKKQSPCAMLLLEQHDSWSSQMECVTRSLLKDLRGSERCPWSWPSIDSHLFPGYLLEGSIILLSSVPNLSLRNNSVTLV